jgi:tRNA (mo5U34)-methyltransferase
MAFPGQFPEKPPEFTPELFEKWTSHWHQKWEIFEGIWTPGRNPVVELAGRAGLPADLSGQRVLDVGAFNGCLSFECERRGAAEVVALDLAEESEWGFAQMKELLGSRVRYHRGSCYRLEPADLGTFDVVLFFGVLYHLRYPVLGLDQLRRVCRGTLYLETVVTDHRFILPDGVETGLGEVHEVLRDIPLWQFYPGRELAGDISNWFGPNIRAVMDGLRSAGFGSRLMDVWGDRAAFQATPLGEDQRALLGDSYEGWSEVARRDAGLD